MADNEPTNFPDPKQIEQLLALMGLGLINWQHVEDEHYLLCRKLLNYPPEGISSVIYHGPPSFESRRVLVARMMEASIVPPNDATAWNKINKRLGDASEHRGQIAHFTIGFDVKILAPADYKIGAARLQPSANNKLKDSQNKGSTNPKYHVKNKQLLEYANEFLALSKDLAEFRKKLIISKWLKVKPPEGEIPPRPLSKVARLLVRRGRPRKGEPPSGG
jgi:hypothetical protein